MADAALARDVRRVFTQLLRRGVPAPTSRRGSSRAAVCRTWWQLIADEPMGEPLVGDDEVRVYVDAFTRTGFTGGINWYRNMDRNWESTPSSTWRAITVPSLMVVAELGRGAPSPSWPEPMNADSSTTSSSSPSRAAATGRSRSIPTS